MNNDLFIGNEKVKLTSPPILSVLVDVPMSPCRILCRWFTRERVTGKHRFYLPPANQKFQYNEALVLSFSFGKEKSQSSTWFLIKHQFLFLQTSHKTEIISSKQIVEHKKEIKVWSLPTSSRSFAFIKENFLTTNKALLYSTSEKVWFTHLDIGEFSFFSQSNLVFKKGEGGNY